MSTRIVRTSAATLLALTLAFNAGCNRDPNVRKQKYLDSGKRYEAEGKYREATLQFFNALKVDKNFADAHFELGKTYEKQGLPNQAYSELQQTVSLAPNNIAARLELAHLLLGGHQPDLAADQAKAVLAAQPNNADGYAVLSGVAAVKGNLPEALTQIRKALALEPNNATYHTDYGLLQSGKSGDQADARAELEKAIQLDPKNVSAHFGLASMLEQAGNRDGAAQQLQAGITADPKDLQARVALANLYVREGNSGAAEATLRKAAEDFADNAQGAGLLERYYARTGQMDKAETAYAQLTQEHPKSFPLQIAYARVLVARGEWDKAQQVADNINKADSAEPGAAMLRASLQLHSNHPDQALATLQDAAKNNPESTDVRVMLGMVSASKGDTATAETNFRSATQQDPANLNAERGLADMANRRNDNSELRQVAENTMKIYPALPEPYVWRGTAEAKDNQLDAAEKDFQTALKMNPNDNQALTEMAQLRIKQGRNADARKLLQQALASGSNPRALGLLAQMDIQENQPQQAIALIQQQIARSPQSSQTYDQLAAAQFATKDVNGAAASASKALQIDPNDVNALRLFTQAKISQNDYNPAVDLWQKYAAAHPNDGQAPAMLGMLAEAGGDNQKAMQLYQKSLQLQPENPLVSNNLAYLMVQTGGNLDVALSLAQDAHRGMPDSPNTADTLAWVYYKKGVYSSALDLLQGAAQKDPNNASVQYHLGLTQERLNNKSEAEAHLKKAASLSPDSEAGKQAQAELAHLG